MAYVIQSDLFKRRGELTEGVRRSLTCQGAGAQIMDIWGRHGWADRTEGVAGVIAEVTTATGTGGPRLEQ